MIRMYNESDIYFLHELIKSSFKYEQQLQNSRFTIKKITDLTDKTVHHQKIISNKQFCSLVINRNFCIIYIPVPLFCTALYV